MATLNYQTVQYASQEPFGFSYDGSVKTHFVGHSFKFTKKNLANQARLTVIAVKSGEPDKLIPCSTGLSDLLKPLINSGKITHREAMAKIVNSPIIVRESDGRYFASMPQGEAGELLKSFALDELITIDLEKIAALNW